MEIIDIIKAVGDFGILIVIAGAVIFLLIKYFSKLIDGEIDKKGKKVMNTDIITSTISEEVVVKNDSLLTLIDLHPYFNKIDTIIKVKLPITKIGGPVRTKIFRDTLRIFYEVQIDVTKELLEKDITKTNFLLENKKSLNQVVEMSRKKMKEHEIPEVVINKFWEWNYKRHEYIATTLSDIDSSTVFNTIIEKQYAALNLYQSCSYFVLIDAEKTLKGLNGDLSGTIYRGQVIEDLHHGEENNDN